MVRSIAIGAGGFVALAALLSKVVPHHLALHAPIIVRLMTPPFVFACIGLFFAAFLLLHLIVERTSPAVVWRFFSVYGENPLAAYVFVKLFSTFVLNSELAGATPASLLYEQCGGLAVPLVKITAGFLFCLVLYRRGIRIAL